MFTAPGCICFAHLFVCLLVHMYVYIYRAIAPFLYDNFNILMRTTVATMLSWSIRLCVCKSLLAHWFAKLSETWFILAATVLSCRLWSIITQAGKSKPDV